MQADRLRHGYVRVLPFGDREFSRVYDQALRDVLPEDWRIDRQSIWLGAQHDQTNTPIQGYIIHVSTVPNEALTTIRRVVPVCVNYGTEFKVARDPSILEYLNSKPVARKAGGKFLTIYPATEDIFSRLIDDIYAVTTDLSGPHVLSDRRYRDSKVVFYRYGGFARRFRLRSDGTKQQVMLGEDGSWIDDVRHPFFSLPSGIPDPFGTVEDEIAPPLILQDREGEVDPQVVLQDRFEVNRALTFSNSGGVYIAYDRENGERVIVKEARSHTHCWLRGQESIDAVDILAREYHALLEFADLGVFPKPIAYFQEGEHWFLAQERVEGIPIRTYRTREDVDLTTGIYDSDRIRLFCRIFRRIGLFLIDVVEAVHARGYVIGDLSSNNVFVQPDSLMIRIIDIESTCRVGSSGVYAYFANKWFTPGFRVRRSPESHERSELGSVRFEDDFYATGMILYSLVLPIQRFLMLHPPALWRFIDQFIDAGLPRYVKECIAELLENNPSAARTILSSAEVDDEA